MEKSKVLRWILLVINFAILVLAILFYKSILSYLIVGFIVAYLIAPIVKYAELFRIPRTVSILVIYIIIAILIFFSISAIIPVIIEQFEGFQETLRTIADQNKTINLDTLGLGKLGDFIEKLEMKFPSFKVEKTITSFIDNENTRNLLNRIPLFFKSIFNIIAFLIVVPVISFFLLKDGRILIKSFFSRIGNRYFEFSIHLYEEIEKSFGRFFRALLIETFLVAVMSITGLLILGIPYALLLGLIVGLANPIKYFGPFIGAVPTLLVVFLGPTPDIFILYVIITFFIVQQIDSLILFPWLIGRSMDLHPMIVLLTVIAGGYTFGILGMLFAVPLVFLIKTILQVSHKSLKEFEII